MRNPIWTRDELILALDLYFKYDYSKISETHPAVIELSNLLISLPIYERSKRAEKFRNPNGVYTKLGNFRGRDAAHLGVGLAHGAELDKLVWDEFHSDIRRLSDTAQSIRKNYVYLKPPIFNLESIGYVDIDGEFPEGKTLTLLHIFKERNSELVDSKKRQVLGSLGKLSCEVCGFDFKDFYGDIGIGFTECHHNIPISEMDGSQKTRLSDLSIICSNCHRIIHRTRPWLSVAELKDRLPQ